MIARRPRSSGAALALLVALLGGCAIAIPPPREPLSAEARGALDLLLTRWHAFKDLRALADITVDRDGDRRQLAGVLLARAPGSVRFEALSPFGAPLLIAVVHDERLTSYDVTTNEALVGPADAHTTARLLHLPFDPDDLVGVLAARAVPPKDLRVAEVLLPDEYGPSLNLIGAVHASRVWMDMTTGAVRRLAITGGRASAIVSYRFEPDGRLAGFDFSAGGAVVSGSVTYRNLQIDAGIDPERFVLTLPKDAKIRHIR